MRGPNTCVCHRPQWTRRRNKLLGNGICKKARAVQPGEHRKDSDKRKECQFDPDILRLAGSRCERDSNSVRSGLVRMMILASVACDSILVHILRSDSNSALRVSFAFGSLTRGGMGFAPPISDGPARLVRLSWGRRGICPRAHKRFFPGHSITLDLVLKARNLRRRSPFQSHAFLPLHTNGGPLWLPSSPASASRF